MSCQLLHRVDPDLNMARFYRVEVLPDLFGEIIVERRWGRIGGRGHPGAGLLRHLDLLDQADFLRPYELLERILTRHRGREYLIARLGPEAEDGIDALLAQALQYETMEAPGLTEFLGWMSTDDSDVKRQMVKAARCRPRCRCSRGSHRRSPSPVPRRRCPSSSPRPGSC